MLSCNLPRRAKKTSTYDIKKKKGRLCMGFNTTLFGNANAAVPFDTEQSLTTNFLNMCRLNLLRVRSKATLDLIAFLDDNSFQLKKIEKDQWARDVSQQRAQEQYERLQTIIKLETVKAAIDYWYSQRWLESKRIDAVFGFQA